MLRPVFLVLLIFFAACQRETTQAPVLVSAPDPVAQSVIPAAAERAAVVDLGRRLFFDQGLSASGKLSCASCHSPEHAYGPANDRAVQLGGPTLDRQGLRAVPSLRYVLNRTPVWSKEFIANPAERIMDGDSAPSGGFGWDGRFGSLHAQAEFPLFAQNEMANRTAADVVAKIQRASYADAFRAVFGADIFSDSDRAFAEALRAIERFELDDASFHPYSSKFDLYLDGNATLTAQEQRGLALFDDARRGNCASCHIDRKGADGSHPLFTDYQFEALGVPRNPELHGNTDADFFDAGLCGPLRKDQAATSQFCGLFKTPGLRNVATRRAFFHNGRFHSLKDALRFYVQRDTDPGRWYPLDRKGAVEKFDDLPRRLRGNVDAIDLPLTRTKGAAPVWNEAEIDDVIAFLETLNDDWQRN